jgi:tRNA 5-methylaminomethyl-2-thiouridine biosynthesis bifunctional protein
LKQCRLLKGKFVNTPAPNANSSKLFSALNKPAGPSNAWTYQTLQIGWLGWDALIQSWRQASRAGIKRWNAVIWHAPSPSYKILQLYQTKEADDAARNALLDAWPSDCTDTWQLIEPHPVTGLPSLSLLWLPEADLKALKELQAQLDEIDLSPLLPSQINDSVYFFKMLARRCKLGATVHLPTHLASASATSAGFSNETDTRLVYAPRFAPRSQTNKLSLLPVSTDEPVLIVGAGLAGCAAAWALAQEGYSSVVLDRCDQPADETSGNLGGLFHGTFNRNDGAHARLHRLAALHLAPVVRNAFKQGCVGEIKGFLRLETQGTTAQEMQKQIALSGLPSSYVQALNAAQASERAGVPLTDPAWFYPQGGWVHPAGLARFYLTQAELSSRFQGKTLITQLTLNAENKWELRGANGQCIAQSSVVVLANAHGLLTLLEPHLPDIRHWPLTSIRGQVSDCTANSMPLPRVPISGAGYVLPPCQGRAFFGSTYQRHDDDPRVREADHHQNLQQLHRLSCAYSPLITDSLHDLQGRTGWRLSTRDKLPLIGPVPSPHAATSLAALPRQPGLFVFSALASRGILWSALGARILAHQITGRPCPVPASLLRTLDPGRFQIK